MIKYRKKPVVIDAIHWTGSNIEEALEFLSNGTGKFDHLPKTEYVHAGVGHTPATGTLDIPTLEGVMVASPGDYIIKGVRGEFYPCKPHIFEETYEVV